MKIKKTNAFTTIELMIAVGIICILATLGVPAYLMYETRTRLQNDFNVLKTVAQSRAIQLQENGTKNFSSLPAIENQLYPGVRYISADTGVSQGPLSASAYQVYCKTSDTGLVPDNTILHVIITSSDNGITTCCGQRSSMYDANIAKYFPSGCNSSCSCEGC